MSAMEDAAARIKALGESAPRLARDPINQPMINNWVEAIGDSNPIYADGVAPPAMIQVWTMNGLHGRRGDDDPLGLSMAALDDEGYTSVVATNCDQTYHRYLEAGEHVAVTTSLESIVGPKQTGLGEGWFVTTRNVWRVEDEPVAEMVFRVLKFKPGTAKPVLDRTKGLRPVISQDSAFFWEGTAAGELRIQHCAACGTLRHPPGPMCPSCGAEKPDYVVASGRGTVFSYVVHHHPQVPGKQLPFVVALVELDEGVRMIGELIDVDPTTVTIGMPVQLALTRIDDDLTLPFWRPAIDQLPEVVDSQPESAVDQRQSLPPMTIDATPTFVVATALATRDFQDVHHDRDSAIKRGSKDIFVNILADTGLVQRYVTDWAGPDARVHSIAIRLGVPCYAYDTLEFSGHVTGVEDGITTVEVVGRGKLGDHVVGTVRVSTDKASGVAS